VTRERPGGAGGGRVWGWEVRGKDEDREG